MLTPKDLNNISHIVRNVVGDTVDAAVTGSEKRVRGEITDAKTELRGEIKASVAASEKRVRSEIKDTENRLRGEITDAKTELRGEIKASVAASEKRVRGEIKDTENQLRGEIRGATNAIMAHVDVKHEQQAATMEAGFLHLKDQFKKTARL